ncbi:MAG: hypothetical protein BTN85_1298 [Candidatus Methanohalarchaeum thermophilum]|uniref:Uncharacterized protein n=1 Tax=Methanohalarchaeum thermophilum TaxID=1903181 RepID=A0A1Q6DWP6_METT1|nr:MAG: hypothetical protein BTN85_1298 [Candidatus Methanohalarchaeum thermophilum]
MEKGEKEIEEYIEDRFQDEIVVDCKKRNNHLTLLAEAKEQYSDKYTKQGFCRYGNQETIYELIDELREARNGEPIKEVTEKMGDAISYKEAAQRLGFKV